MSNEIISYIILSVAVALYGNVLVFPGTLLPHEILYGQSSSLTVWVSVIYKKEGRNLFFWLRISQSYD